MSRDEAGNLAVSNEYTFTTMGISATLATSDWETSIEELDDGKEVSIGFLVTNTGDIAGSYQASLSINGAVEETRNINLAAGASQEVIFTINQNTAGTYIVTVDELALSFTVEPRGGINWWLIIAITAGVLFLTVFGIFFIKRSRQKTVEKPVLEIIEGAEEETYPETEETKEEAEGETDRVFYGLTVTALALLKLREILQSKTTDTGKAFRITLSTSNPTQLKMILDWEKEGDKAIESEGTKLLLLAPDLIPMLEGMIIDYQITPQGGGFSISRLSLDE